ncbi:P-loop NTPase fold protein [Acaryochloris sp. IP29b_bin.137]|uniref:P-loop NTPase fold protein n=1 Tax=Acaryochloris sp. IP29b_bin.137 TaxID=2969217 RepID=UPI0026226C55|nr:P-loop NTPase fold protein [Acaryochloris sp. IP29b_bin.137]
MEVSKISNEYENTFDTIRIIENIPERVRAYSEIAPKLPPRQKDRALKAALSDAEKIEDKYARIQALVAIAPQLSPRQKDRVLETALSTAERIVDYFYQAQTLVEILPQLPRIQHPEVMGKVLSLAPKIKGKREQSELLSLIATKLSDIEPQFQETVKKAFEESKQEAINDRIAQSFNNDIAEGEDLLGIESEVNALAEVLGMRSLKPPLAVGILGGWGSGKSFVMHLMRRKLKSIYQRPVSKEQAWGLTNKNTLGEASPFVGHIYQIYFNSWNYAKADLWSSLMQTIFYELNYQLTTEKHLQDTFAIHTAVIALISQLSVSSQTNKPITPQKIKALLEKIIHNHKETGGLQVILDPKFWQQCADLHSETLKQVKENSEQNVTSSAENISEVSQNQDTEVLQPPGWESINWEYFEQINKDIGLGTTEQWKLISCQTFYKIWVKALEASKIRLLAGGQIWRVVDSELTVDERDLCINLENSFNVMGTQILQDKGNLQNLVNRDLKVYKDNDKNKIKTPFSQLGFLIWQTLVSNARTQGVIWEELSDLRKYDQKELVSIEESLANVEKDLENQKKLAELSAQKKLEQQKITNIWKPILNQAYTLLGIDPDKTDSFRKSFKKRHSSRIFIGVIVLAALLIISASSSLEDKVKLFQSIFRIYLNIGIISFPTTAALLPVIWSTVKQYLKEVDQAQAQLDSQYQEWLIEAQNNAKILELSQEIKSLRLQAEQKRRQVGLIANQSSLLDFVNNRIQSDDYDQRLGLIHQISRDLDGLSQRLYKKPDKKDQPSPPQSWQHLRELFPRGPARVILYIDDLDRCPPDRVVDVLEAVQLLINTPLFVVVLAIDDRYIARALENAYKGVLKRKGSPSGIDYLEKIIQIPYRTRPITGNAIGTYLKSQIDIEEVTSGSSDTDNQDLSPQSIPVTPNSAEDLSNINADSVDPNPEESTNQGRETPEIQDVEPPPPEVAKFTPAEFRTLKDFCQQVDLSPRTAKRLINIYKILKILWFRSKHNDQPKADETKRAVLALLVLAGRYPTFMREVLAEISRHYEEHRDTQSDPSEPKFLKDCFREPLKYLERTQDPYLNRELQKFFHDVDRIIKDPLNLPLIEISEENFYLVLSFCFVGDIGYDPEDYQSEDRVGHRLDLDSPKTIE